MNIKKTGLFLVRFFIIIKEELFYFFKSNNTCISIPYKAMVQIRYKINLIYLYEIGSLAEKKQNYNS